MTIELCRTVSEFRASCERVRQNGGVLGLVPTMGALHAGHTALVTEAVRRATEVAVTIFVNPTQFGPTEDLEKYPRTLERDLERCEAAGARLVFAPSVQEMYPADERTRVSVKGMTAELCGASRPSHFDGVATIVAKLFAVAGPCTAIFGRKDYQQLKVIQRMTRDLLLPVTIVEHPTIREPDGLAMSSRNAYLSEAERVAASSIPRALAASVSGFQAGERRAPALRQLVSGALEQAGLRIDYVALADPEEVTPLSDAEPVGERALLAVAAFAGTTRLIDNVVLGEDANGSFRGGHG